MTRRHAHLWMIVAAIAIMLIGGWLEYQWQKFIVKQAIREVQESNP
jgi:hypothetical protein